jgi:hypothetical protein
LLAALMGMGMALALGLPTAGHAATCGGNKVCECGDKVVRDYTLPADLGPCPKDGLRIGGDVAINGGGHAILGSARRGFGIRLGEESSGARVSDLTIRHFKYGVRLVGAQNVRLSGLEVWENGDTEKGVGYGIDFSSAASHNVLERVRVHHNADEGIHLGTNATGNRITDSEVYANGRENVYFLSCRDNRLVRSKMRAPGAGHASVYIKFATGTVIEDNTIDGGNLQIRGASRKTLLAGNKVLGGDIVLESQNDKRFGRGTPSETTLRGGSITTPGACVRVAAATQTRIEDVALDCPDGIRVGEGSRVAVRLPARAKVTCAKGDCVERLDEKPTRAEDRQPSKTRPKRSL